MINTNGGDVGSNRSYTFNETTVSRSDKLEGLSIPVAQKVNILNPNSNCFTIQDVHWDKFYC